VTIVEVFHDKSASDFVRVFWLVGADQEYSWADRESLDGVAVQPLVEPNELCHESHVRIRNLSFLSDEAQALVKGDLLSEYHVA
jgi:hypothetical protein